MGFLADIVSRKSAASDTLDLFKEIYGGRLSTAGVSVNWRTAIRVAAVLACARVKAEGLAQVPLKIMRKTASRREQADDLDLFYVLDTQPNPWQTAYEYRETVGLHLSLAGFHYSFINRIGNRVVELIPFMPGQVEPRRASSGEITYRVTLDDGAHQDFPQASIWHIRALGWNGWQGLDVLDLARDAVGLSIAAEDRHAQIFRNGLQASGVYAVEGTLNSDQYKQLRQFIVDNHSGVNAGMPMVLDRGAKWLQQAMSGVDMQHYEVRRHQVEEVCRAMGVLPIAIGHSDKTATFASAEAFFSAHDRMTMLPLYTRVEKSINAHLLGRRLVQQGYYAKHIVNGLLRASAKDRGDYFSRALGAGGAPAWLTQDEVRELEDINPMGGSAAQLAAATNVQRPTGAAAEDPDE